MCNYATKQNSKLLTYFAQYTLILKPLDTSSVNISTCISLLTVISLLFTEGMGMETLFLLASYVAISRILDKNDHFVSFYGHT